MSRIDDSDNQRIKDMQEQELRNRVDREKKDGVERVGKSFQQLMQERSQKQTTKQQATTSQSKNQAAEQQSQHEGLKKQQETSPRAHQELSRRAAISSALQKGLAKTRSTEGERVRQAETERTEDLAKRVDDEKERIDKDLRDGDEADVRRAEDRDAEMRRIDPDAERRGEGRGEERGRRGGGGDGGESGDEQRAKGVQAAEVKETPQAHQPRIPPEVIEKIVSAIQSAHTADGRTEMHIDLKGPMLEGVRLEVKSDDGKVTCTFRNCDRSTKALLEASKGALMRGLAKKGLTLVNLKVA